MNDDATLTALRGRIAEVDPLGDVHMTWPVGAIFMGARKRRRTRRALAGAGLVCAALGLALAVVLPSASRVRAVHVHVAAWSVDTGPSGTVTFTLRSASDPTRLERVLAQAGVPAMVRWGEICLAQGRHVVLPTPGIVTKVNGQPTPMSSVFLLYGAKGANKPLNWSWTIVPARIPQHARFVISEVPNRVSPSHIQAAWEFVPSSAPVTCTASAK